MKCVRSNDHGMETPTSLFLLILSSMLIFGVVEVFTTGQSDPSDLFEIRDRQVNSMGDVLLSWYPGLWSQEIGPFNMQNDTICYWDSGFLTITPYNGSLDIRLLEEFFGSTPDDLPSLLILDIDNERSPVLMGEYVKWAHSGEGYQISLVLPLYRNDPLIHMEDRS